MDMMFAAVVGYMLGSVPFGLILTRLAGLGDIRKIGSGNIGATNVLRAGSKVLAAATLLLDIAKGIVAVVFADWFGWQGPVPPAYCAAAGVMAGHLFPVWLGFRGGKGVATYIGVLVGLAWPMGVAFCVIWMLVALVARLSSLAALVASGAMPIAALVLGNLGLVVLVLGLSTFVVWKHDDNIRRLLAGEEPKIGAKS